MAKSRKSTTEFDIKSGAEESLTRIEEIAKRNNQRGVAVGRRGGAPFEVGHGVMSTDLDAKVLIRMPMDVRNKIRWEALKHNESMNTVALRIILEAVEHWEEAPEDVFGAESARGDK